MYITLILKLLIAQVVYTDDNEDVASAGADDINKYGGNLFAVVYKLQRKTAGPRHFSMYTYGILK